ncbi:nucleoside-diphosphate-sugar epimerase [Thermanaerovibrio velox DSM 12556]|uniref:Nucleoside-diphosphate-sugar epimerase n=1 Tax=Thermanaerovibrio velox DSM 12556 TaxID=926567 RepID=H0UQC0_9BACT|nr:NAD-dependent epimerase/dehydratase family protein [Thermanaerovibrio velox]EHM10758.1 nucleoside-diphosphate-sugar epimerase [Thermanaerovibrio velox DSM 12556]
MKRILVTGAGGQIGSELVPYLWGIYGASNVLATDVKAPEGPLAEGGPFDLLDVRDGKRASELIRSFKADSVLHLAGILSAKGEENPNFAWDINVNGTVAMLEAARENQCAFFFPSSIAAFGPSTPRVNTPQDTIQRPTTVYGIAKASMEMLCDYYHAKFGLDTRGLRFPGLISYVTPPGGGTTDYAVHIYYDAITKGSYTSFIAKGTYMDMMYMPDALQAVVQLMEADPSKLKHRNAFNISAMSFDPEEIAESIRKFIPSFRLDYQVDPLRQSIAESWPDSLDCSAAREEWGFNPKYGLDEMTKDMLEKLREKLNAR